MSPRTVKIVKISGICQLLKQGFDYIEQWHISCYNLHSVNLNDYSRCFCNFLASNARYNIWHKTMLFRHLVPLWSIWISGNFTLTHQRHSPYTSPQSRRHTKKIHGIVSCSFYSGDLCSIEACLIGSDRTCMRIMPTLWLSDESLINRSTQHNRGHLT
jgi:hypothetical protein